MGSKRKYACICENLFILINSYWSTCLTMGKVSVSMCNKILWGGSLLECFVHIAKVYTVHIPQQQLCVWSDGYCECVLIKFANTEESTEKRKLDLYCFCWVDSRSAPVLGNAKVVNGHIIPTHINANITAAVELCVLLPSFFSCCHVLIVPKHVSSLGTRETILYSMYACIYY